MFFFFCFKRSRGEVFEHQQRLGQKIKAGIQMQLLIPTAFIWDVCHLILSNAGHPQFLIFSAERSLSAELAWSSDGPVGTSSAGSEPDFAQRQIFDAWFCSFAFPTFTELLWSRGCSLSPFRNLFLSPVAAFGGFLSNEKKTSKSVYLLISSSHIYVSIELNF